jgi:hypothetical protein
MSVQDWVDFLSKVTEGGNAVGDWLFTDLNLPGLGDIGKPIFWIGSGLFITAVIFWLKNKIVGDVG